MSHLKLKILSLPCCQSSFAYVWKDGKVYLFTSLHQSAQSLELNSVGARELASALIEMADFVDTPGAVEARLEEIKREESEAKESTK